MKFPFKDNYTARDLVLWITSVQMENPKDYVIPHIEMTFSQVIRYMQLLDGNKPVSEIIKELNSHSTELTVSGIPIKYQTPDDIAKELEAKHEG